MAARWTPAVQGFRRLCSCRGLMLMLMLMLMRAGFESCFAIDGPTQTPESALVTLSCRLRPMGDYFEGARQFSLRGTRSLTNGNRSAALPPGLGIQTGGRGLPAPPLWLRLVVAATKSHGIWSARSMPVVGVGEPAILTVRDWPSRNQQFLTNGSGTGLGFWCSGTADNGAKDCRSAVVGEARHGNISIQACCCRLPMAVADVKNSKLKSFQRSCP